MSEDIKMDDLEIPAFLREAANSPRPAWRRLFAHEVPPEVRPLDGDAIAAVKAAQEVADRKRIKAQTRIAKMQDSFARKEGKTWDVKNGGWK